MANKKKQETKKEEPKKRGPYNKKIPAPIVTDTVITEPPPVFEEELAIVDETTKPVVAPPVAVDTLVAETSAASINTPVDVTPTEETADQRKQRENAEMDAKRAEWLKNNR